MDPATEKIEALEKQMAELKAMMQQMMTNQNGAGNPVNRTGQTPPNPDAEVDLEYQYEEPPKIADHEARLKKLETQNAKIDEDLTLKSLCMFPNLPSPPINAKPPDIAKYNGTGCPISFLKIYTSALMPFYADERWLVSQFPHYLTGPAVAWFTSLDPQKISSFTILCKEFKEQYSFNIDIKPTRMDLEALKQKDNETFAQFVGRWRGLAQQLPTKPTVEEAISMIRRNALPHLAAGLAFTTTRNFQDLSMNAAQIEAAYKEGTFSNLLPESYRRRAPASNQINHTAAPNYFPRGQQNQFQQPAPYQPRNPTPAPYQRQFTPVNQVSAPQGASIPNQNPRLNPKWTKDRVFSPLPKPLPELFRDLKNEGFIRPRDPRPPPNPLPWGYRTDLHCEYHQAPGHSTERCWMLKHIIQDLIDEGEIAAGAPHGNIHHNPMPVHNVNAIEEESSNCINYVEEDESEIPGECITHWEPAKPPTPEKKIVLDQSQPNIATPAVIPAPILQQQHSVPIHHQQQSFHQPSANADDVQLCIKTCVYTGLLELFNEDEDDTQVTMTEATLNTTDAMLTSGTTEPIIIPQQDREVESIGYYVHVNDLESYPLGTTEEEGLFYQLLLLDQDTKPVDPG